MSVFTGVASVISGENALNLGGFAPVVRR